MPVRYEPLVHLGHCSHWRRPRMSGGRWKTGSSGAVPRRASLAVRARIMLACAQGGSNIAVAARLGVNRQTVNKWRARFLAGRLDGLTGEPRQGVPRTITDAQVEQVVVRTLEEVPEGSAHWPERGLAARVGISPSSVLRIWRAFGLQPWRAETLKVSPDPLLIDKIREVAGMYLAPPANAAEFSDRQAVRPAPGGGLPRLPGPDRTPDRPRPGGPRDLRQPVRAKRRRSTAGCWPARVSCCTSLPRTRRGSTRSSDGWSNRNYRVPRRPVSR